MFLDVGVASTAWGGAGGALAPTGVRTEPSIPWRHASRVSLEQSEL